MSYHKVVIENLTEKTYQSLKDTLNFWDHFEMCDILDIPEDWDVFQEKIVIEARDPEYVIKELKDYGYNCHREEWECFEKQCPFCKGSGILKDRK